MRWYAPALVTDERPAPTHRLAVDTGTLPLPAVVVHGGAGTFERISTEGDRALLLSALREATAAGYGVLEHGRPALDAVVEAVARLEESGRFNAGRGAVPTTLGTVEFDASVMDGATGALGAICAATHPAHPVRAARTVAERGGLPDGPVLLAGAGADRFCEEHGLEQMRPEWLSAIKAGSSRGTVGAVAVDRDGKLAAATSTGGRAGQLPGRVGDSPVPGAGVLASTGLAVSATGSGEVFLAVGFAHRLAWSVAAGAGLVPATGEALSEVSARGGEGGAIVLGGDGEFVAAFSSLAMARAWRAEGVDEARIEAAEGATPV